MIRFLPKNNKKGVTLVESVFAVVILGIFAVGILTLLTSGGTKIKQISHEASAYTEATQKMDIVISSISSGAFLLNESTALDCETIEDTFGLKRNSLVASIDLYPDADAELSVNDIRGWYLKLTHKGVTVSGFASNSGGVFDKS